MSSKKVYLKDQKAEQGSAHNQEHFFSKSELGGAEFQGLPGFSSCECHHFDSSGHQKLLTSSHLFSFRKL